MPNSTLSGTRLGPYQVHEQLGAGGMGEVYRATDTRLGRDVAVKVLPSSVASDPQLRARLHREAQLISALDHPHVCVLHDVGQSEGIDYLVLELLKGHTLLDRLRKGPLPIAQVLHVGSQIANGLAAAHGHGVVHRDLKPGNVMLTPTGVKLLDFGLAKPLTGLVATAETQLGESPATAEGSLTGTLQYMAPEQVQGAPADTRSDIFALGAVLHEMVTGRKAFEGTNHASVIAKVLDLDPPPVSTLVPVAPRGLDHVVQGCLAKTPDARWQSAHDVHLQLEWLRSPLSGVTSPREPSAHGARRWFPWVVAALFALAALALLLLPHGPPPTTPTPLRFRLPLENARLQEFDVPELSPDERRLAYTALKNGRRQLFVNDLRTEQTVALPGTDGALFPFWSPDGRTLAFFADGSLKRVALAGGAAQAIAPAPRGSGGTWTPGTILFAPSRQGVLHRLNDSGGTSSPVTADESATAQGTMVAPNFLPDGVHYTAAMLGGRGVYLASLDAPKPRHLITVDTLWARFAAGHLLYLQGRRLMARPFDPTRLGVTGHDVTVAEPAGLFSVRATGTVVYAEPPPLPRLTWVSREGAPTALPVEAADFMGVAMSRSGRRAAVWSRDDGGNVDLWEVDLGGGALSRLTTHPAADSSVAWSPDERQVAFHSGRLGRGAAFVKDLASGAERVVHAPPENVTVEDWTPDGRQVIVRAIGGPSYLVPVDGDRRPRMFIDTPYVEDELTVSPDGRWIAFNSDESGSWEVYIAAFPDFKVKRQVSRGGGVQPRWRGDGKELFFLSAAGAMMSARVSTSPGLDTAAPAQLFAFNLDPSATLAQYAVTPDGQRFLVLDRGVRRPDTIHVLLNWLSAAASAGQ